MTKQQNITISENERKCLKYLAEIYPNDEANCTYFRVIAKHTGLKENKVRIYVRSLARKSLVEYVRGLVDYDGMVAGSGYMATFKGALLVNACIDCKKFISSMSDGRCNNCWNERICKKCRKSYKDHILKNGYKVEFEF